MGKLAVVATTVFAFFSVENAVAWDLGIDDRSCYVPPQISCGGCAIACRLDKVAVCRRGMNVWRSTQWSCLSQPRCLCRRSSWRNRYGSLARVARRHLIDLSPQAWKAL
jgi:hypothetical protein